MTKSKSNTRKKIKAPKDLTKYGFYTESNLPKGETKLKEAFIKTKQFTLKEMEQLYLKAEKYSRTEEYIKEAIDIYGPTLRKLGKEE